MTQPLVRTGDSNGPRPQGAPTTEQGYDGYQAPGWGYFSSWANLLDPNEVPELQWPNNIAVYHRMRTDSQVDALIRSVTHPVRNLRWELEPNGARDEVVQMISTDLNIPIRGNADGDTIKRGRKRFNFDEYLRLALLAPTVYGHMVFEMVGDIDPDLAWRLRKLAPRMPQSIKRWNVARDGGLTSIEQYEALAANAKPLPIENLVVFPWEKEGANWVGRSMLRPLFKHWLIKDRLIRVDAMKNERFGIGVPKGTAPVGGDPADYQKMASAVRASENGGVGVPNGADFTIEGIRGTLPDTIGSIRYHDEAMARSFLAMFMQLGQTQTGSRALSESFLDFFAGSLSGFADWFAGITNEHVIEDIVDWNWSIDENAPILTWTEDNNDPLDASMLAELIGKGALIVDAELQQWIRKRFGMPDYTGGDPLPTKPGVVIQTDPSAGGAPVAAGGKPSQGTPADKRLKDNKATVTKDHLSVAATDPEPDEPTKPAAQPDRPAAQSVRPAPSVHAHQSGKHDQTSHGTPAGEPGVDPMGNDMPSSNGDGTISVPSNMPMPTMPKPHLVPSGDPHDAVVPAGRESHHSHVSFLGSSQTVDRAQVGHRQPTDIEVRAATDFERMQQEWQSETDKLVKAWGPIRSQHIDDLVSQVQAAVDSGNLGTLAGLQTQALGGDIIYKHAANMAKKGVAGATAEAKAQGVTVPVTDIAEVQPLLQARSEATAALLARSIAQSAATQALNRYGVDSSLTGEEVAAGVRSHLEGLTDSYLNDQLGGVLTAAQNTGRRAVMGKQDATYYSSELLDANTCEFCSSVDGQSYDSVSAAELDYPTGGFKDCAGGPRCRGTLVAVYAEGDINTDLGD